ncbi:MAG TPA: hypothetical protein VFO21_15480 [Vicinamibacterales bacterium]|nr:hypothetical protein [Vicinamibacterales bacterium]
MKSFWTAAALLGLLAAAACGGRDDKDPTKSEEPPAPTLGAPAEPRATAPAEPPRVAPSSGGPASPARRAPQWREVTVPQGTAIPLELETPLSSETTQLEAPVRARVRQAVIVNGVVAIPTGAMLSGVVTHVERAGRVQGRAQLAFVFTRLEADDVGENVNTAPVAYVADATKGEDATKIGVGAVGGAIVGGILGGGGGAAKGAVIGGAAGTGVVLATRGDEVTLGKGTILATSLASPLTVRVPAR